MLNLFIVLYFIYVVVSLMTAYKQMSFVSKRKKQKPAILNENDFEKAGDYVEQTQKLSIITTLVDIVMFAFWLSFGLVWLDNILLDFVSWQKAVLFIDIFILVNWIVALPFSLYNTFVLDKEYEFSNMTTGLYMKDTIKTGILFLVFGSAIIGIVALIVEYFHNWWIYGFVFVFAVIILINMLYPIIRDKMFDKFEKLSDEELENKINSLLQKVGFKSSGVFSVDASKRDNRLNAYFGGLGSTKRVVLFDTLIKKLNHDELLAVLGHELGHFKNGDVLKNIGIMGLILFVFFAIFGNLDENIFNSLGITNEASSIIAVFMIFSPVLSFFIMPMISFISRHNEYNADKFGSDLSSKENLTSALLKLVNENRSFPFSHEWFIFFYYSHPPLSKRLEKLGYKESE
ncbi:MAG: M48 family peptidase [Epsilonproteobacteria bacterium]|nr:MAG: M48 family peptidase [Campylobacterota bacterium]